MDTRALDQTIKRARRGTIGDAVRRSTARNPGKDAIVFGERRWSYAELDAGVNRVANALLAQGLEKGDRVAAYGMNSDAYVLLWLGCSRAGLIHVPVNFHLAGEELLYILDQSGSKALFYDPGFEANVEEVWDEAQAEIRGTLYDGDELDVVSVARSGEGASEPEVEIDDEDVAQILYTSGTTSAPKGAVLTHRALMTEYVSCIEALEFRYEDRVLHSLPLYHSAQMHVCIMPNLLVGATNCPVTGRSRRRRGRPSRAAGSIPGTSATSTKRATSTWWTGSKTSSTPAASRSRGARWRTSSSTTRPSPRSPS
jgi:fatty-acyl-CoA synthase